MANKRRGAGRVVGRAELAEIFGVSVASVDHWLRSGAPCDASGATAKFNTAEMVDWRIAQAVERVTESAPADSDTLDDARRRKTQAEAELAEIEVAEKRGEVVNIAEAARTVAEEYAAVRAKLLGIPGRLAPLMAIETDQPACKALLVREITEALNELVGALDDGAPGGAGDGPSGGPEAAAGPHGEPVGGLLSQAFV